MVRIKKYFPLRSGGFYQPRSVAVRAVDDVSFSVDRGETISLVGESGCGKTTIGRVAVKLLTPTEGSIQLDGQDITNLSARETRAIRRRMQIIFQDPQSSLNPRMRVGPIIQEPLQIYGIDGSKSQRDRVFEMLEMVGLPADSYFRFPHEFSGGQRQRIGIARAMILRPSLIVADEPVSALDVSIQAQIVNLLNDLQDELGLTYIFIAHDLSVVRHISDRVAVIYLGKIVEMGTKEQVYSNPLHPYTKALFESVPIPDPDAKKGFKPLTGEVPNPMDPPKGCHFHPRCPFAFDRCQIEQPKLDDIGEGHLVSCFLYREGETGVDFESTKTIGGEK